MTLEEIRERLNAAMPIRVPIFDPGLHGREKVSKLEEHLLLCAWHRGELEEALHWAIEAGKLLRRQWDGVEGWDATIRATTRPTKEQVDGAKRIIAPDLWTSLDDARTLVESLRRQITRLGGSDYDAVSRAYTLISGS